MHAHTQNHTISAVCYDCLEPSWYCSTLLSGAQFCPEQQPPPGRRTSNTGIAQYHHIILDWLQTLVHHEIPSQALLQARGEASVVYQREAGPWSITYSYHLMIRNQVCCRCQNEVWEPEWGAQCSTRSQAKGTHLSFKSSLMSRSLGSEQFPFLSPVLSWSRSHVFYCLSPSDCTGCGTKRRLLPRLVP